MEELKVGDIIKERYELVRFLGNGGFGEVWLAHDQLSGRDVALKIYLTLDPAGIEEFQREYANTIDLSSPFLLTPEYFDVYGRRPFLVMKYCENGSSSKLAGSIRENQLWLFIQDVANGLAVLHNQSDPIVHQDIKPDNILIDGNGRFLITDFGISKRLRATMRRQSKRDVSSGAMPYMSPERFDSNPRLNTASDIWSLGASIYELAMGELPFSGFGGAMQRNGANMPSLPNNYSPVLNEIMQSCLNSDVSRRPLASELANWTENRTLPYDKVSTESAIHIGKKTYRPQTTVSESALNKNKGKIWISICAIICLLSVVVLGIFHNQNIPPTPMASFLKQSDSVVATPQNENNLAIIEQEPNILSKKDEPAFLEKELVISEGYYRAIYKIRCTKGLLDIAQTISGQYDTYQLQTNPNIDLQKIVDQFEGLAYFWAASEIGANIINENGSYSDEYMRATISFLSKSADAFSVKRGNSPLAYDGAKSRKDMLSNILNGIGDMTFYDIEMIVWGMGEHPVKTKDIKLDLK